MKIPALCLALCVLFLASPTMAQKPKVLIINSYHAEYPWVQAHNCALGKGLEDRATLEYFYMDTKRLPKNMHEQMAQKAYEAVLAAKPDVVVLTDDNALMYLGSKIASLNIPIVYLGINGNPRQYLHDISCATGVLERPLLKRSLVYLIDILGDDFKKCLVLFDSSQTSQTIRKQQFYRKSTLHFEGTETHLKLISNMNEWKKAVLHAQNDGYQALIIGLYHTIIDEDGNHVDSEEIARWTSAHSPVPVFGFWDFSIGKGLALGGLVHFGEEQGKAAAHLVNRCLSGEPVKDIETVTAEQGKFLFSKSEMERWGIVIPDYFEDRINMELVD